jgi:hypothetical protein
MFFKTTEPLSSMHDKLQFGPHIHFIVVLACSNNSEITVTPLWDLFASVEP